MTGRQEGKNRRLTGHIASTVDKHREDISWNPAKNSQGHP